MPACDALAGELADDAAGGGSDGRGREQRRREEAHDEADAAADLGALAPEVVAGLLDLHLALGVLV